MPVSPRDRDIHPTTTQDTNQTPHCLRPYTFHGVDLTHAPGASHAVGDCPFCGRDGKFSVDAATGLWRCFVCGSGTVAGGGNAHVFIRLLHERSMSTSHPTTASSVPFASPGVAGTRLNGSGRGGRNGSKSVRPNAPDAAPSILGDLRGIHSTFAQEVLADRRLCEESTVAAWGVCQSVMDHSWLVPGYGTDGKLDQLYRRARVQDHGELVWRLLPTPGVWPEGKVHALHLPHANFDLTSSHQEVYVCEGPWDGMALWEVVQHATLPPCQVIAVPGCNVWRDEWSEFCRGKRVTLLFDSDHPRVINGHTFRAGFDGMYRVAKRLSGIAASVRWLRWGREGYDPDKPSGYDVRDFLSGV